MGIAQLRGASRDRITGIPSPYPKAVHSAYRQITGQPLVCNVDRARMLQVLANLITNAIEFTPRGGAIRVHGERTGGELRLGVSDGHHLLKSVFERFWRVSVNDRKGPRPWSVHLTDDGGDTELLRGARSAPAPPYDKRFRFRLRRSFLFLT